MRLFLQKIRGKENLEKEDGEVFCRLKEALKIDQPISVTLITMKQLGSLDPG